MVWFGADPGGKKNFGVAVVQEDGTYQTACVGFVDEAVDWIRGFHDAIDGVGIDAPLWWSSGQSGDRKVDQRLRKYGPVQAPNSLVGAVLTQGVMLATRLRELYREAPITEAHPKALLRFLKLSPELAKWKEVQNHHMLWPLKGDAPSDHERDAVLAAVAARNGMMGRWCDLSADRHPMELDPKRMWFGEVSYFWPDKAQQRSSEEGELCEQPPSAAP